MCQIINDGTCPDAMTNAEPGHLSHARWLTTANRILRVYISSDQPSNELDILVRFVVIVYAPSWFDIK